MHQDAAQPRLAYIDCVRGYAVLLVITCHLNYFYLELPWPVHRFTGLGMFGVQLFFMASALTLLMSWRRELERAGKVDIGAFFIRRFFRIAPVYYIAAAVYLILKPPAGGFDPVQLLISLLFVNAWHPATLATAPGAWTVVPGGWSIGVEFCFYAIFPVFVTWTTSARRWTVLCVMSLAVAIAANRIAANTLVAWYDEKTVGGFVYWWPLNQFIVFVFGAGLFLAMRAVATHGFGALLARWSTVLTVTAILGFLSIGYSEGGLSLGEPVWMPSKYVLASIVFGLFVLALSASNNPLFLNRLIEAIGRVSFSAYLWHFAVLQLLPEQFGNLFHTKATGYAAIFAYACAWVVVVAVTFAVSWCTYQSIELPGIRLCRCLIRWRAAKAVVEPVAIV
jgi:peptidoglycan/LPS O-acetylase OafA/YrhL